MGAPAGARAPSIPGCVGMAVIAGAAAAGLYLTAIAGAGFPDGHRTDYERWSLPFQTAVVVGLGLLGVGFAGLRAGPPRVAGRLFRAGVVATIVLVVAGFVVVPRVGRDVLRLEHGEGG